MKTPSVLGLIGGSMCLLVVACGDDTRESGGNGGGGAGGPLYGTGGCDACVEEQCKAELSECGTDAGCNEWVRCLDACGIGKSGDADPDCEAACPVDGSVAAQGRDAIVACRRSGAGATCAACGITPATASTGGPALCTLPAVTEQTCGPSGATGCEACYYEECCDSSREVFGSGPAADLVDCWLGCANGDGECANDCYADHPDGIAGFGNFRACIEANCGSEPDCLRRDNACRACNRTECPCEAVVCYADVSCHEIYECATNCNDSPCIAACIERYPEGQTLYDNLSICQAQHCVTQCLP